MSHLLGLDIGGTKIAGAVLDAAGEVVAELVVATPGAYDAFLEACVGVVRGLEARVGAAGVVGVGIAGRVERQSGCVFAPNLPFLAGRSLRDDLAARLGRSVVLANDADCMALSEAVDGAGAGFETVLGLILGTGVGSGLVRQGRVVAGPNGLQGEIGFLPLPFREESDGPPVVCPSGQKDSLGDLINGAGLARLHGVLTGKPATAAEIGARAAVGDADALRVLDHYYSIVAKAMVMLIYSYDPDIIVVGGGLSNLPGLCEEVAQRWGRFCWLMHGNPLATRLARAKHGPISGVRGAAWLSR